LVERANRTLSRLARTMMLDSQLPTEFWALALSHAAFISNRVCHTHSRQTPFEKVFRKRPDLSNLKVWGCPGVVHVEDKFLPKDISLPHATAGIFVGYDHKSPSYLFYMPATQRLLPRRDAVLFEDRPGVLLPEVGADCSRVNDPSKQSVRTTKVLSQVKYAAIYLPT